MLNIEELSGLVDIEKQEDRELVKITLTTQIRCDESKVVAAGVDVDGLEVLPSVRIELIDGITSKEFPAIKIFRQFDKTGDVKEREYNLTVAIGTGKGVDSVKDIKMIF